MHLDNPTRQARQIHCGPEAVEMALSGEFDVITTYREPWKVKRSWINNQRDFSEWRKQWAAYRIIRPLAKVYQMSDLTYHENAYIDHMV